MSQINPYQPPRSDVADIGGAAALGAFVEGGRAVGGGHGWTWIAEAFQLFRKRPGAWILVAIVLGVMVILMNFLPIIGAIGNMLLMPVFAGGLLMGCRALEDDGDFGVGNIFAGFSHRTGQLVALGAASVVAWIVIMIPLFVIVGRSFFGIMGGDPEVIAAAGLGMAIGLLVTLGLSVPVYMALWFAPCLVVFEDVAPRQALAQSFRACARNIVPFLLYGIVFMVLFVVAAIPLMLGYLVVFPVLIASVYTAYRDIFYDPA